MKQQLTDSQRSEITAAHDKMVQSYEAYTSAAGDLYGLVTELPDGNDAMIHFDAHEWLEDSSDELLKWIEDSMPELRRPR